jgi:hypothetical protein
MCSGRCGRARDGCETKDERHIASQRHSPSSLLQGMDEQQELDAITDCPSPARDASSHPNRLDKFAARTAIGTTHDAGKYNPLESNRNVPVEKKSLEHTHKNI